MSNAASPLFQPYTLGSLTLKNRLVMSPMTRQRAIGNVPGELMVTYYRQRANAGLIITEGTAPTADGLGYPRIPGVFSDAQVAGWRPVTDAVHAEGGAIFVQLMHTGRASHEANLPPGARVLAPSAVKLVGEIWVDPDGNRPASEPTAMTVEDIEATLEGFAQASARAVEAGFDGVELHAANGYLIDQFLNTASNLRTDAWGGSVENRFRFAVEAAKRSAARIGASKVGIRLSPYGAFNGMQPDPQHDELYTTLAGELSALGLAYVHVVDHSAMGAPPVSDTVKASIRKTFKGSYVLSGGYDRARAEVDLVEGKGDLVAFGRPYLANPDLAAKLASGAALAAPDFATFYTPGPKGYTDYAA